MENYFEQIGKEALISRPNKGKCKLQFYLRYVSLGLCVNIYYKCTRV